MNILYFIFFKINIIFKIFKIISYTMIFNHKYYIYHYIIFKILMICHL